jgi:hypothetical protein
MDRIGWPPRGPGPREIRALEGRRRTRASEEEAEATWCPDCLEKPLAVMRWDRPVPHTDTGGLGDLP